MAFGAIVWRLSDTLTAWLVLLIAAIVWLGLSIAVWLLARRLKRRH